MHARAKLAFDTKRIFMYACVCMLQRTHLRHFLDDALHHLMDCVLCARPVPLCITAFPLQTPKMNGSFRPLRASACVHVPLTPRPSTPCRSGQRGRPGQNKARLMIIKPDTVNVRVALLSYVEVGGLNHVRPSVCYPQVPFPLAFRFLLGVPRY